MTVLEYKECRNKMVSMIMNQDILSGEIQLKALCDYCYTIGHISGYSEGHSDANKGLDKRQVSHVN